MTDEVKPPAIPQAGKNEGSTPPSPQVIKSEGDNTAEMERKSKYIRSSIVKKLFQKKEGEEIVKIRIAGEAMSDVMAYLDKKVEDGVTELIAKLPVISKGDNKGKLKRITIKKSDITGVPDPEDKDE